MQLFDAAKHNGTPLLGDALEGLEGLEKALAGWQAPGAWSERAGREKAAWEELAERYTAASNTALPSDAQVIGAVQRQLRPGDVVLNAAGGLPGELHKLFRTEEPLGYHMEYGFSCMGYEIAGGIGTKLALPDRNVIVMVGDGSYLMLNSELATSVLLGQKLTVVVLDNHGFGCINRLQHATGGEAFNNLLPDTLHAELPALDFVAHAREPGRDRREGLRHRRSGGGAGAGAGEHTHACHRHRNRRCRQHGCRRRLVGRGGARGFAAPASDRGARPLRGSDRAARGDRLTFEGDPP